MAFLFFPFPRIGIRRRRRGRRRNVCPPACTWLHNRLGLVPGNLHTCRAVTVTVSQQCCVNKGRYEVEVCYSIAVPTGPDTNTWRLLQHVVPLMSHLDVSVKRFRLLSTAVFINTQFAMSGNETVHLISLDVKRSALQQRNLLLYTFDTVKLYSPPAFL